MKTKTSGRIPNPATATQEIKAKNADDIETYSPDEIARLLDTAPDRIRPANIVNLPKAKAA